ncbi:MAG: thioredoxin domain-containing protein [Thermoplasmata archaeon]|nr:thioredoxin domain-containing protein [Thermoplasmata archaeon]
MEVFGPNAFDGTSLQRTGTWVVDFSAEWCPFCREFLPKFSTLAAGTDAQLAIGDLTDVESPLWDLFHLEITPTMIVFRDCLPVFRRDGRWGEGLDEDDLGAVRRALGPGKGEPAASRDALP